MFRLESVSWLHAVQSFPFFPDMLSVHRSLCTTTHYVVREYEVVIIGRLANHTMSALELVAIAQ